MATSVHDIEILDQLEDTLRQFVKTSLEQIMQEELRQVSTAQQPETRSSKSCVTHKMRHTTTAVRQKDRSAITSDLKKCINSVFVP